MKTKILFAALATMMFCQCSQPAGQSADNSQASMPATGLKIACVNVDSLLGSYNYYLDLAEDLMRKEENYRLVLAEDAKKYQASVEEYSKKVQNNVFSSAERAQSERNRLMKMEQTLNEKQEQFSQELNMEQAANSQKISETIDAFLKEYNKEHGFNLIITKAALLYSDDVLDITADVIEGLNADYKPASEE